MADRFPRVIGLKELLSLRKPLRERPAPLVYFSDKEFAGLIKGADQLKRRPPSGARPLASFDDWPGGGVVQSQCESPPGQVCVGQWTPAGPGHGGGVFFTCDCKPIDGPTTPPLERPCRLMINPAGGFQCDGECKGGICRLGYYRDPATERYVLDCRCRVLRGLTPA
jgi:hypothetical protein